MFYERIPKGSFSFVGFAYIPFLMSAFRGRRQRDSHLWSSTIRIYNLADKTLRAAGLRIEGT